jgi:hypothetical protein
MCDTGENPGPRNAAMCSYSGLVEIDIILFIGIISKKVITRAIVIAGTSRVSIMLFLNEPLSTCGRFI